MTKIDYGITLKPSIPPAIAQTLEKHRSSLDDIRKDIEAVRTTIDDASNGETSEAIVTNLSLTLTTEQDLRDDLDSLIKALIKFGQDLESVDSKLVSAASAAKAGGLPTSFSYIYPPSDTSDPDYNSKVELFNSTAEDIYYIRLDEACAFEDFESACDRLRGIPGLLWDALVPQGKISDISTVTSWLERLSIGTTWGVKAVTKSRFAPRWPANTVINGVKVGGQFRKVSDFKGLDKLAAKTDPGAWVAAPGKANSVTRSFNAKLAKSAKAFEKIGKGMAVLDGALAAYDQWQEDSANPSMGTGEKVARATTHGLLEGAGGYYGAAVGAQWGATFGAVGGPVGIAVGGIVGGVVGGIIGSKLGEKIADGAGALFTKLFH